MPVSQVPGDRADPAATSPWPLPHATPMFLMSERGGAFPSPASMPSNFRPVL